MHYGIGSDNPRTGFNKRYCRRQPNGSNKEPSSYENQNSAGHGHHTVYQPPLRSGKKMVKKKKVRGPGEVGGELMADGRGR